MIFNNRRKLALVTIIRRSWRSECSNFLESGDWGIGHQDLMLYPVPSPKGLRGYNVKPACRRLTPGLKTTLEQLPLPLGEGWDEGLLVQLHADTAGDFFVGFNQATQALAEAVLVHLGQGILVPQAATVWGELIA